MKNKPSVPLSPEQRKSLRRFRRICRNFKELPQLSKSDLVSILTELYMNFFSIAVSLSQAQYTPDPAFNEEKNKELTEFYKSARRKAYEDWYYLGAIGATTSKEDMSNSFDCLGDKALIVQRRFLSRSINHKAKEHQKKTRRIITHERH